MKINGQKFKCQIIDGRRIAERIHAKSCVTIGDESIEPGIAAILIGDDKASNLYVNLKEQACEDVKVNFNLYRFHESQSEEEIIETIKFLNTDPEVNAILVQLPLPSKFNEHKIIEAIDPKKDVDGFHPENLKLLKEGKPEILSPLALGVDAMIKETKIELNDKKIAILSNHEFIAEPFKHLYGENNEVYHVSPKDNDAKDQCHDADILIVAIGQPLEVNNKYIKDDAVVIDIGINKLKDKTVGDVDFNNVMLKASFISPVPGGVGPLTIAFLIQNTIDLFHKQNSNEVS